MRKLGNSCPRLLLDPAEGQREVERAAIQISGGLSSPWQLPLSFLVLERVLNNCTFNLDTLGKYYCLTLSVNLKLQSKTNKVLKVKG